MTTGVKMLKNKPRSGRNAKLIPAPGDPYYLNYSYNPMSVGVAPPDEASPPPAPGANGAPPPIPGPVLPVAPPPTAPQMVQTQAGPASSIFAGSYGAEAPPPPAPRLRLRLRLPKKYHPLREVVADAEAHAAVARSGSASRSAAAPIDNVRL